MSSPILPQGAGYGVVIGMGLLLSICMVGVTKLQTRYTHHQINSAEEFSNASRSVPAGLIAAGIISAWTWLTSLLQSSSTAYQYGICGPWWASSGATVQVLMFAMLAAKLKLNAPYCHTYLEIIRVRWGKFAHITFLFFALSTNVIISTMLVLGGSAALSDLTGMNTVAACFLIPSGVAVYVLFGGMRATLIADYMHTFTLYCILISFVLIVFCTSSMVGSPGRLWNFLNAAARNSPVVGNAGGSYLTMRSKPGVIFGIQSLIGNFGAVFSDQSYHLRAIASHPQSSVKAFLLGGLAWFGIPLSIATSLGLSAVVLVNADPSYFAVSSDEVSEGLPAVKAIVVLAGKARAGAMLVLLLSAVTSSASAEQMAVSSLFTYDIYTQYIRPNQTPTDAQLIWISHLSIVGYAVFMGSIATTFYYVGLSMGYLSDLMGTLIGSVVVPIAGCICWKRTNGTGAVVGAIGGFCAGVAGWIATTAALNGGVINVDTTFGTYEMLTGNCLSIGIGGMVTIVWTIFRPDNFDWEKTRAINAVAGAAAAQADSHGDGSVSTEDINLTPTTTGDATRRPHLPRLSRVSEMDIEAVPHLSHHETKQLHKAFRIASILTPLVTFTLIFLVPMPQYFANCHYSESGFTAWVVIVIVWLFGGFVTVGLYPIYQGRKVLGRMFRGVVRDLGRVCR